MFGSLGGTVKTGSNSIVAMREYMRTMLFVLFSFAYTVCAYGADKIMEISLAKGLDYYENSKYYSGGVDLYFGKQKAPTGGVVIETRDITLRSSRRADSSVSDRGADPSVSEKAPLEEQYAKVCHYIFSSVLQKMKAHAVSVGATAIVNISGFWEQQVYEIDSKYQCVKGWFHTAVSLRGEFVRY